MELLSDILGGSTHEDRCTNCESYNLEITSDQTTVCVDCGVEQMDTGTQYSTHEFMDAGRRGDVSVSGDVELGSTFAGSDGTVIINPGKKNKVVADGDFTRVSKMISGPEQNQKRRNAEVRDKIQKFGEKLGLREEQVNDNSRLFSQVKTLMEKVGFKSKTNAAIVACWIYCLKNEIHTWDIKRTAIMCCPFDDDSKTHSWKRDVFTQYKHLIGMKQDIAKWCQLDKKEHATIYQEHIHVITGGYSGNSKLAMDQNLKNKYKDIRRRAFELVENVASVLEGSKPQTIAAISVYCATEPRDRNGKLKADLAGWAGISPSTFAGALKKRGVYECFI